MMVTNVETSSAQLRLPPPAKRKLSLGCLSRPNLDWPLLLELQVCFLLRKRLQPCGNTCSETVPSEDFITQVTYKAVFFAFSVFAAAQHGLLDVHIAELHVVLPQRVVEPPQEGDTH